MRVLRRASLLVVLLALLAGSHVAAAAKPGSKKSERIPVIYDTGRGGSGPRPGRLLLGPPSRRTDLRGHGRLRGHLLTVTDARRHGDGPRRPSD